MKDQETFIGREQVLLTLISLAIILVFSVPDAFGHLRDVLQTVYFILLALYLGFEYMIGMEILL